MTRPLRCTAGHVVGVEVDSDEGVRIVLKSRDRGRRSERLSIVGVVYLLRCTCGAVWRPETALPLSNLEVKAPSLAGRR